MHYVSTSVGNGLTTTIVGDVDQTSGTQTIVVSRWPTRATMVIELVGHEAYFRGTQRPSRCSSGLPPAVAAAAAGQWVSVVPTDSVYQSTAAALTVGSVMSELALAPPITGGRNVRRRRPDRRRDLRRAGWARASPPRTTRPASST